MHTHRNAPQPAQLPFKVADSSTELHVHKSTPDFVCIAQAELGAVYCGDTPGLSSCVLLVSSFGRHARRGPKSFCL